MTTAINSWLALSLAIAAGTKAWQADAAAAGLSTYGLHGQRLQRFILWLLVALEFGLAVALVVGATWAPAVAAALFALFTVVVVAALLSGRLGRPCACFGGRSRLSRWTPLRSMTLGLAAVVVWYGWLPDVPGGYARWLTVGWAVCVAGLMALGLVMLALAREVGVLRLGISSQGALELADEGPVLGTMQTWVAALPWRPSAWLGLAVFTSDGCPLCRQLAPAVRYVAADPLLAVGIFDEVADAALWSQARVPGSPYAVAVDSDGIVRAKGTFNSLPQLESIIGTARHRTAELAVVT